MTILAIRQSFQSNFCYIISLELPLYGSDVKYYIIVAISNCEYLYHDIAINFSVLLHSLLCD